MPVQINKSSRLNLADLKLIEGVEFWDLLDLPVYEVGPADLEYVVKDRDRLDNLAYTFYGDPVLWWVIAWANDIELPPVGMAPGSILIIPDPTFVNTKLFNIVVR